MLSNNIIYSRDPHENIWNIFVYLVWIKIIASALFESSGCVFKTKLQCNKKNISQ